MSVRAAALTLVLVTLVPCAAGAQRKTPAEARAATATSAPEKKLTGKEHMERAEALHAAGLYNAAAEALKLALLDDPKLGVPAALGSIKEKREKPASMAVAEALAAAGLHAEAKKALETALAADPSLVIRPKLQYLLGGPTRPVHDWLVFKALPAATTVLEVLLIAVVAVLLLRRIIHHFEPPRPVLHMDEFGADGVEWTIGKTLRAMTEETLRHSRTARGTEGHQITTGPIEPIGIPNELATALPSAASVFTLLATLMKWLLPANQISVAGILHKPGRFGAGLTLLLVRQKQILTSVTVWEIDYGPVITPTSAQSYYGLVEPAVIWLQYELCDRYDRNAPLSILGATSWRSYAAFRAGARVQVHDPALAMRFYRRALAIDPANRGARTNLAVLMLPWGPDPQPPDNATPEGLRRHARAIDQRRRQRAAALAHLRQSRAETPAGKVDPSCILASYMLAAVLSESQETRDEGVAEADRLIANIESGLKTESQLSPIAREYLADMRPTAIVMWAGILPPERAAEAAAAMGTIDETAPSAELQYNLACAKSVARDYEAALDHLETALELHSAFTDHAKGDPWLEGVRSDPSSRERFSELTADRQRVVVAQAAGLAELNLIGPNAARLAAVDVRTPGDLVLRASTLVGQTELAARIEVAESTVRRWAHAAELMRLGMTTAHVNVLIRGGIDSLSAFGALSSGEVLQVFNDFSGGEPRFVLPSETQIATWRQTAGTITAIT